MGNGNAVALWRGPAGIKIPPTANTASEIVPYAATLKPAEQTKVIQALEGGFYDMGAEFVWRRAMSRLRHTIATLGPEFVAEMIDRKDLASTGSLESHLTDYDTIRLAEALGIVNPTGTLRLRHAFELLDHFTKGGSDEELPLPEAMQVIRTCVQYALGEENIGVAVDFARFRDRLLGESLRSNDDQVQQFVDQPPFFLSTALRVLLSAIRKDEGAKLQHALGNLGMLLPLIWGRLPETERWSIGELYTEATTAGRSEVILDLKRTLLKVKGFDYVPENLRSAAFRKAARALVQTHFEFNNFYNEGPVVQQLAALGTVVPKPAVAECIRAYLCVYLGNKWGHSFTATPVAHQELVRIGGTNWDYYFSDVLKDDDIILAKLIEPKSQQRFAMLSKEIETPSVSRYPPDTSRLVEAARVGNMNLLGNLARKLLAAYKPVADVAA